MDYLAKEQCAYDRLRALVVGADVAGPIPWILELGQVTLQYPWMAIRGNPRCAAPRPYIGRWSRTLMLYLYARHVPAHVDKVAN